MKTKSVKHVGLTELINGLKSLKQYMDSEDYSPLVYTFKNGPFLIRVDWMKEEFTQIKDDYEECYLNQDIQKEAIQALERLETLSDDDMVDLEK